VEITIQTTVLVVALQQMVVTVTQRVDLVEVVAILIAIHPDLQPTRYEQKLQHLSLLSLYSFLFFFN